MNKSYEVDLPKGSLIQDALKRTDYYDAYAIQVPTTEPIPLESLVLAFFDSFPKWFGALLYIREKLAGLIGLKTATGMNVEEQIKNFKGQKGEAIALFKVYERTENELILGENDKHLDFRLSFLTIPKSDHTEIIGTTTVQFNGWLGKAYFLPVKPFHRLIMPIMMKRIVANL